jgi:hypothetical protein
MSTLYLRQEVLMAVGLSGLGQAEAQTAYRVKDSTPGPQCDMSPTSAGTTNLVIDVYGYFR